MNVHLFSKGPSPAVATFGLSKTAADGKVESLRENCTHSPMLVKMS